MPRVDSACARRGRWARHDRTWSAHAAVAGGLPVTAPRLRLPDPLPVVIVAAGILVVWQAVASLYFDASVSPAFRAGAISGADPKVPPEMRVVMMKLPLPSLVLAALLNPDNASQLWLAGLITLRSAVIGFVVGGLVGCGLAVLMAQTRPLERVLLPYAIVSQMVPVIALGPSVYSIFKDENTARILIAAYVTFFPVTVNTLKGLRSVEPNALALMTSLAASRRQIYVMLRLPTALPYIFQALKIAATASVIGAIVVELMGAQQGIGVTILRTQYYGPANATKLWGAIVVASLLGLVFFRVVAVAERLTLRWQPEFRS
jgi:NitT/TauT family transport system permease protein